MEPISAQLEESQPPATPSPTPMLVSERTDDLVEVTDYIKAYIEKSSRGVRSEMLEGD